jgi:hypothetical protein
MLRAVREGSRRSSLAIVCAVALGSVTAGAQQSDPVAAEQLFEVGRSAMDRKDYAIACQRFAESERLDPAAGTLINLAECFERQGLVASSWQRWKEALDALRPGDERRAAVEQRVAAALVRLPKLELRLEERAPEGTVVARDGLTLGAASLRLGLPVDPGAHHVVVTAPGHAPREYTLTIAEAESKTLLVTAGPAQSSTTSTNPTGKPTPPRPGSKSGRTWGFVAVSIGAAGLIVGGTAGALALSKKHSMDEDCTRTGGTLFCGDKGLDAEKSGKTFATLANIGVAVGIVGVGLGGYLLFSSGSDGSQTAAFAKSTTGGATLGVSRTF